MKCTIIVCTYNRAHSLERTLRELLLQDYPQDDVEILIIDNNSNDSTKHIVDALSDGSRFKLHYLFEAKQGLSNARNTGIRHARGDIVIFIDDDAYPKETTWIQKLASVYQDSTVGAAGGDAEPVWPSTGRPDWLHDKLLNYLGVIRFGYRKITPLNYPNYPYGVNISFRKSLIQQFGGFDSELGRKGDVLLSAEETELCYRVEQAGYSVVYVPKAEVLHVMASDRLTAEWFIRRSRSQGMSKAKLEHNKLTLLLFVIKIIRRCIILIGATLAQYIFKIIRKEPLALYFKCLMTMSLAYLKIVATNQR